MAGSTGDTAKKITVRVYGAGVCIAKIEKRVGNWIIKVFSEGLVNSSIATDFSKQTFGIVPPELDGYESTRGYLLLIFKIVDQTGLSITYLDAHSLHQLMGSKYSSSIETQHRSLVDPFVYLNGNFLKTVCLLAVRWVISMYERKNRRTIPVVGGLVVLPLLYRVGDTAPFQFLNLFNFATTVQTLHLLVHNYIQTPTADRPSMLIFTDDTE